MNVHPFAELFPLMDSASLAELSEDIRANGLREAVVLIDGAVLDGRNRLAACELAGVEPRFRDFEGVDPLAYVLSLNLARRHLNESQRAMVAARLANMKHGGDRRSDQAANLPLVSQAAAAERLHVAERSVRHATVVARDATPEIRRAVDDGKLAVSAASQVSTLPVEQQRRIAERAEAGDARAVNNLVKQDTRAERERDLAEKQTALPDRKFGVIVADPEWRFEVYSRATGLDRSADNHYPTSALEAIKARDVTSIAADDCVLFLWSPANRVGDAIDVMRGWGFTYVSQIVWGKSVAGTGYWVRDKHEVLLIGRRGKVPAPAMGTQCESLILAPATEHSAKPEIFLEIVEHYFPHMPKIELNRRGEPRKGWFAWGNEAEMDEIARASFEAELACAAPADPEGARGEDLSGLSSDRADLRPEAAHVAYAGDRSRKWNGDIGAKVAELHEGPRRLMLFQIAEELGIATPQVKGIWRRFNEKRLRESKVKEAAE